MHCHQPGPFLELSAGGNEGDLLTDSVSSSPGCPEAMGLGLFVVVWVFRKGETPQNIGEQLRDRDREEGE